ncbi:hypothetical protein DXV75_02330 [Alteromonas aestuariivivens]|uniref:Uncharacterized protein n=1 Tax=Alteromonas aestuariivivens TaxID=1938339 RepID=A0A3D8MEK8_9ALTE|nr:hypothetical protein [Alteromonas aestuariivivens]RDV29309.1 hypothetical protein DXV75_02330 [Alteromonas aestuariivivens]
MQLSRIVLLSVFLGVFSTPVLSEPPHKAEKLPKGLHKKAQKGKELPPGWQKKLHKGERLDQSVYEAGNVIFRDHEKGVIAIEVDDKVIRLLESTHEIIDVLDEF